MSPSLVSCEERTAHLEARLARLDLDPTRLVLSSNVSLVTLADGHAQRFQYRGGVTLVFADGVSIDGSSISLEGIEAHVRMLRANLAAYAPERASLPYHLNLAVAPGEDPEVVAAWRQQIPPDVEVHLLVYRPLDPVMRAFEATRPSWPDREEVNRVWLGEAMQSCDALKPAGQQVAIRDTDDIAHWLRDEIAAGILACDCQVRDLDYLERAVQVILWPAHPPVAALPLERGAIEESDAATIQELVDWLVAQSAH